MKSKRYHVILANGESRPSRPSGTSVAVMRGRVSLACSTETRSREFCAILGFTVVDLIKRHELPKL